MISALALGISAMVAGGAAANAAEVVPGINIDLLYQGSVVTDGTEIPPNSDIQLRIAYDAEEDIAGKQIVITLPDGVLPPTTLPTNDAVQGITPNPDGTYTVTFKNPIPEGVTEGAFALNMKTGPNGSLQEQPITWKIGDQEGGVTIIVNEEEEPPAEVTNSYAKSVNPTNLNQYVQRGPAPDFEFLGLSDDILTRDLDYTLTLGSADARTGYQIADQLPAGVAYVDGSFAATLTTATGTAPFTFNPTVNAATRSFSGTVDVPAQSTLRVTYKVRVTDKAALETQLRTAYEARNGTPGNYSITPLRNTATFGDNEQTRTADVGITGNIPGVGVGTGQFNKSGNWTLRNVVTDEEGNLTPPAEMTYTLRANLNAWNGQNANFTLDRNVVIADNLIEQASWKTGDADFISVTDGAAGNTLTGLTNAGTCPAGADVAARAAAFADDGNVGQYCVDGRLLLVNVGKTNTVNANIAVKAQLNNVNGLTGVDRENGVVRYPWNNTASFYYRDGAPFTEPHNANVDVIGDGTPGEVTDTETFRKQSGDDEFQIVPGQAAEIPYTFTVNTGKANVAAEDIHIIDTLPADTFNVSDLASIPVTGTYGSTGLVRADFDLTLNGNDLRIELSEAGKAKVAPLAAGQVLTINIVLTTKVLTGKETLEIHNRATLHGEGTDWVYVEDDDTEATSFGNEAEMRKRVFDRETNTWLPATQGRIVDGAYVNPRFVYSIELIPRGNYGSEFPVQIFTRNDDLPDDVEFLGFVDVDGDGIPADSQNAGTTDDMNGNIEATYADGVVTIRQKDGTNLNPAQGKIVTYFAVNLDNASEPVVNTIAGSEATITPVGDPSIDIEKWNDEGETPEYDESGALQNDGFDGDRDSADDAKRLRAGEPLPINFTVSNDGLENLVDVVVTDELTSGEGAIENLSCDFSPLGGPETGTTWDGPFLIGDQFECTGTLPALSNGDTHSDTAKVTARGEETDEEVEDEDEWHGEVPTPSIDIEKWNVEGEEAPRYEEGTGALLNDQQYAGDRDSAADAKQLEANKPLPINFTISNDGVEDLIDVEVSDQLTGGKGAIEGLTCDFSPLGGPESGTTWAGPFEVGTQFQCTGTLPALQAGDTHSDNAIVTGVGIDSGTEVDDNDDWHATVPVPGVDIEKWTDEGEKPEYDESGNVINDGYKGDFDKGKGKHLTVGKDQKINFTVSNNGSEPLVDIVVTDKLVDGKGHIKDLVCTFPDGSKGTTWDGPFEVATQFDCTGTLPGLKPGEKHVDTADVAAWGFYSGIGVDDSDDWQGYTNKDDVEPPLAVTGGQLGWMLAAALLLLGAGGAALVARRRKDLISE